MYWFLLPLLAGFACDWASAFTTACSRRWGQRRGRRVTFFLRMVIGMPAWATGLALAVRTPAPRLFPQAPAAEIAGWLLVAAGCLPMIFGLLALRFPAALPSTQDALVAHGIYAHIRHPIYAGMLLEFLGLALLFPTPAALPACALGLAWIFVKTRLEELDLVQRMPAYRAYMQRVPRFLPRLPRKG